MPQLTGAARCNAWVSLRIRPRLPAVAGAWPADVAVALVARVDEAGRMFKRGLVRDLPSTYSAAERSAGCGISGSQVMLSGEDGNYPSQ